MSNVKELKRAKPATLITGGSSGIGLEFAKLFARDGHKVIIVSEKADELKTAAAQIHIESGQKVKTITANLATANGVKKLFNSVTKSDYEIGILVNNAGIGTYGEFGTQTDLETELEMIQLNVTATVHLTKLFLPGMIERNYGKILITSSMSAIASTPLMTVYGATKAFGYIFAEGLRQEVKDKGITVTALLPGNTETNFFIRADTPESEIISKKADAADVAKTGYDALMSGKDHVIPGIKNKLEAALADILPKAFTASQAK